MSRKRDQLAREVNLLGTLLGEVITEQAGQDAFELVERVRRATIAARRSGSSGVRDADLAAELTRLDLVQVEVLVRAFGLYFQLTNLAEEKQRVRRLRERVRAAAGSGPRESPGAALAELAGEGRSAARLQRLLDRLWIAPVLTAHPTEARRRTLLVALRRVYRLLDRLDDPRLTPAEDDDLRRRLREEISLLWHTAPIRAASPGPLDEVRSAMAFFDESLFVVTPRLYRSVARASGALPAAFLHWGSWIGGDRDGHPLVTAPVTREAMAIQSEHVLRAYEAVSRRLAQTISARCRPTPALAARLADDVRSLPDIARRIEARFADEPFRRRFSYIAEHLARTRTGAAAGYASPSEFAEELAEVVEALRAAGLDRVAEGELQDLRWQLATFGFHGLSLEIRQHSEVHAAALAALDDQREHAAVAPGVTVADVTDTLRVVADIQAHFGPDACQRYVVSFTRRAADATAVLELARRASVTAALDVVPLFESADALSSCAEILEQLLADPAYRRHLRLRGDRQEVMLGYSDSTKESGSLAAAWMLYRAEGALVRVARRHGIELTLFHGRGGALGRGGGPMTRAILAQAPGSVAGRLKLTEQGEVIANRYANPDIALRHLEQLTYATLLASAPRHPTRAGAVVGGTASHARLMDELATAACRAYRGLVWDDPAFEDYFLTATPIRELAGLNIGSRPAGRHAGGSTAWAGLGPLRAIPWVFAWSQSRANIPGWYGTGTAITDYQRSDRRRLGRLRSLYRSWPFFASFLDNTELALAKADMSIAERYASLAGDDPDAQRIWGQIRDEFERTASVVLDVTGRARLLDNMPVLQRSIGLRNPYVDSLSELQVLLLARVRELPPDDPARPELLRLVHLTVSGVAAGLQNTG